MCNHFPTIRGCIMKKKVKVEIRLIKSRKKKKQKKTRNSLTDRHSQSFFIRVVSTGLYYVFYNDSLHFVPPDPDT